MRCSTRRPSSGQAVVFLLAALVILLAAFLWYVDLHTLVTRKIKAQNAGDAAALAAARWQANTLNLIGQLNLAHVAAREAHDDNAVAAITSMQARISFAGPLTALAAAQAAAKKNGIEANPEFTALLRRHAQEVFDFTSPANGRELREPYPNAWTEYHDALINIANDGVAAGPDNARFYADPCGDHILLTKAFYEAVAGREWCWFFLNHSSGGTRTILDDFTDHTFFGPLPDPSDEEVLENPEIFSVGIEAREMPLRANAPLAEYLRENFGATTNSLDAHDIWFFYDQSIWRSPWPGMTLGMDDSLPLAGSVRDEYDYAGADAVTRLYAPASLLSFSTSGNGATRQIVWTAAARPFGYIIADGSRLRPNSFGLVLPSYRDIRLIPLDAASYGNDSSFDIDWRQHCDSHLPDYLDNGALAAGCRYCVLLGRFEDSTFRRQGSEWLSTNSYKCTLPSYGHGRGGGTRRGH
ncbi:MAG: hypothetical protein IKO40_06730 [Kiritimatiellae bacterium]|nr:hypothetical protein [Kiritimatiellia bacterium]